MFRQTLKYLFILFLVFNLSCKKDTTTQPPTSSEPQYFPSNVGNYWIYKFENVLSSTTDTVTVKVINEIVFSSTKKECYWQRIFKDKIDTVIVDVDKDSIKMYKRNSIYIYNSEIFTKLILPFVIGNLWYDEYSGGYKVDSLVTISVIAGKFENCFYIIQRYRGFNDFYEIDYYYVPKVGIVKKTEKAFGWTFNKNNNWELIDYKVN